MEQQRIEVVGKLGSTYGISWVVTYLFIKQNKLKAFLIINLGF